MATYKYLDKIGLEQVWEKIKALIPQPEDDINVLNLLTEFGYSTPLSDADNKVVTDDDGNIILG